MKLENLSKLSERQFRRVTGVKRKTFNKMVELVSEKYKEKHAKGGRPHSLTIEEMVLLTFEYLREYRTYACIAVSYGLAESNAWQTSRWVEKVLIESGAFRLPGKKALYKNDGEHNTVLVDATESPIERPKKNKVNGTPEKKRNTR
jgi:Helix-turn-helix of DDE superfamily endonuclease